LICTCAGGALAVVVGRNCRQDVMTGWRIGPDQAKESSGYARGQPVQRHVEVRKDPVKIEQRVFARVKRSATTRNGRLVTIPTLIAGKNSTSPRGHLVPARHDGNVIACIENGPIRRVDDGNVGWVLVGADRYPRFPRAPRSARSRCKVAAVRAVVAAR
jgi:hypothetical protein